MEAIRRPMAFLALVIISAVVVGCGSQSSASTTQAPTTRVTAPATAAASSPTPQPAVDPAPLAHCDAQQPPSDTVTRAGDILIAKPFQRGDYPAVRLPDQTPLKPFQVPVQVSLNAFASGQFPGAAPVNPGSLTGSTRTTFLVATICNASASQSHVVQSVSVRLAALTPYSGQVNVWSTCDTAFSRQNPNVHTGGCGGGMGAGEYVRATFPSGALPGSTVVATQTYVEPPPDNPSLGPLPVRLAPGEGLSFLVIMAIPDMAGAYAFSIGFQIDGAPAAFGPSADAIFAAPVAHTFTGAACNTPTMLTQIPAATTPETYYICPQ